MSRKARGTAATGRGLRGQRTGEASQCCQASKRSKHGFQAIFLQESGITQNQLPAAANLCQRHGWQLLAAPANSVQHGGRGGVAILVREPLAISHFYMKTDTWGQILSAELLGFREPLTLVCAYRRPNANMDAPFKNPLNVFQKPNTANGSSQRIGIVIPVMTFSSPFYASLVASTGHLRSSRPTDSLWISQSLHCETSVVLGPLSDHYGSFVQLSGVPELTPSLPSWEFQKVAPWPVPSA